MRERLRQRSVHHRRTDVDRKRAGWAGRYIDLDRVKRTEAEPEWNNRDRVISFAEDYVSLSGSGAPSALTPLDGPFQVDRAPSRP